ncbi:MAG: prepilin-type N-terminal cleavage/methylation domain-containing protein [Gemmatimonadaceae bacterium]|nr:prepilin-type N-terminal cleavage/methylation domain-containing protein [Gemmatimonadaceae bacterium]
MTARSGFSLVEVLIASVLFAMAIMGLLGATDGISRSMSASRWQMIAAGTAQRRIDSLHSLPCSNLPAGTTGSRVSRGIVERWAISGNEASRRVELSLTVPRAVTTSRYVTLVPCR